MKKSSQKIISGILCVVMVLSLLTTALAVDYGAEYENQPDKEYAQNFTDVPKSHWAFSYIAEMSERGVLNGYPNKYYYPDKNVTRAEFSKIMTMAAGLSIKTPEQTSYVDVATTDWYTPYVEASRYYLSGYVSSSGKKFYKPNDLALREDIAVALVKLKGYDTTGADVSSLKAMFTDWQSISEKAQKYVAVAIEKGLISGYDDNTFKGQKSITRAEAATLLWRAYQYGNGNKEFDEGENEVATTPTPQATKAPAATPSPVATTPNPTETTVPAKPYVVDTLISAKISDMFSMATMDDNDNIYYYDQGDGYVYKLDVKSKKKTKIQDISKLIYQQFETVEKQVSKQVEKMVVKQVEKEVPVEENANQDISSEEKSKTKIILVDVEEKVVEDVVETVKEDMLKAEYISFSPIQLFFDDKTNKVLLNGAFTKQANPLGLQNKTASFPVIYEIQDGIKPYSFYELTNQIAGTLGGGTIVTSTYHTYYYDDGNYPDKIIDLTKMVRKSNIESWNCKFIYQKNDTLIGLRSGVNTDYSLYDDNSYTSHSLYKYDFSNQKWVNILDESVDGGVFGLKNDTFYIWDVSKGQIIKWVSSGKLTKLNIDTKTDVEVLDYTNLPIENKDVRHKFGRCFITKDEKFIFYDHDALRIIKKKQS